MPLVGLDVYGAVEDSTGAFQATLLWEKIVMHLERSVKSRRRTRRLRTFEDCFPGSKAVECLTDYLNTILPKTIQRSQVRTLCQKLLLTGVIEDVKNKEKSVFQERRLYRFTGYHFWKPEARDGTSTETEKVCLLNTSRLQWYVHHYVCYTTNLVYQAGPFLALQKVSQPASLPFYSRLYSCKPCMPRHGMCLCVICIVPQCLWYRQHIT